MTDRNPCQSCSAPTTLFLCLRCQSEMRAQLHSLAHGPEVNGKPTAGLLDALADVELKMVRMGTGSGHRKKGDEMPVPFIPDASKRVRDKLTGEESEVTVASAQGWAITLLTNARNTLTTIVRDLCESRGIDVMRAFRVVPADLVGPLMPGWKRALRGWDPTTSEMATWLASAVHAIACDESAGVWRADIDSLVRQIQRAIDRPVKIEMLGLCSTQIGEGRQTCDTMLRAPEDAIEVRCRKCRTTRRCDTVRAQGQSDAKRALITWEQVVETNRQQPDGWRVPDRTLRDWKSTGALSPREFQRLDGKNHGLHRRHADEEPLFAWSDVERLRSAPKGRHRKRMRAGRG